MKYTDEQIIKYKEELAKLVIEHEDTYSIMLMKSKKYLGDFVNYMTPLLQDKFYKWSTKCYWVLHDFKDFPICPICGKSNNFKQKNIGVHWGYQPRCSLSCMQRDPEIRKKQEETCKIKYGVKSHANPVKVRETKLKRYGDPRYCNKEKQMITNLKKYGVKSTAQLESSKEKQRNTNLKRYGVEAVALNPEIRAKQRSKYTYENKTFDSMPEIALYIYLKENDICFEYQPNIFFLYKDPTTNKTHKYFPDFKVGTEFWEIKSDAFLKDDGTWHDPWNHNGDAQIEAKHQCLLNNGVKILYGKDYKKYVEYVNNKYGKGYLIQFHKNNPKNKVRVNNLNSESNMNVILSL